MSISTSLTAAKVTAHQVAPGRGQAPSPLHDPPEQITDTLLSVVPA